MAVLDEPLVASTCLRCRAPVWSWTGARMAGRGPVLFDLVIERNEGAEEFLLLHGCCFEGWPDPRDDDRPATIRRSRS